VVSCCPRQTGPSRCHAVSAAGLGLLKSEGGWTALGRIHWARLRAQRKKGRIQLSTGGKGSKAPLGRSFATPLPPPANAGDMALSAEGRGGRGRGRGGGVDAVAPPPCRLRCNCACWLPAVGAKNGSWCLLVGGGVRVYLSGSPPVYPGRKFFFMAPPHSFSRVT
jgi:hypothetical protein